MNSVTTTNVQFYGQNGYFLPQVQLFAPAQLAKLQTIFEEHLAHKGAKLSDELDTPHFEDERLLEFLLSQEALDFVEAILGPNLALWSSHFICKDPFVGRATPWHEDSAYWEGRVSSYDKIVTIWLALDPSTRENGCMRVIPQSHYNGFSDYERLNDLNSFTFDRQIKEVDETKAVYFELQRGEFSMHDARIIHGAQANTSSFRRCGYTMRYFSTEIKVFPEKNPGFKLWLARGQDIAGNTYINA